MTNISSLRTFRLACADPLFEADRVNHFRIRVVHNSKEGGYAVAAIRCEDQQDVLWLSASVKTPLEAVKMMINGFELSPYSSHLATRIIEGLLDQGKIIEQGRAA